MTVKTVAETATKIVENNPLQNSQVVLHYFHGQAKPDKKFSQSSDRLTSPRRVGTGHGQIVHRVNDGKRTARKGTLTGAKLAHSRWIGTPARHPAVNKLFASKK